LSFDLLQKTKIIQWKKAFSTNGAGSMESEHVEE